MKQATKTIWKTILLVSVLIGGCTKQSKVLLKESTGINGNEKTEVTANQQDDNAGANDSDVGNEREKTQEENDSIHFQVSYQEWDDWSTNWTVRNKQIYCLQQRIDSEEKQTYPYIAVWDSEGSCLQTIELAMHSYGGLQCNGIEVAEDGSIWLLAKTLGEYMEEGQSCLIQVSSEGEILQNISLDAQTGISSGVYTKFVLGADGYLYVYEFIEKKSVLIFDTQGTYRGQVDFAQMEIENLVRSKDGIAYVTRRNGEVLEFWEILPEKLCLSEEKWEIQTPYITNLRTGIHSDFIGTLNASLVELNLQEGTYQERLNWLDMGVQYQNILDMVEVDENTIVGILIENGGIIWARAEKVEASELPQKTMLTIASLEVEAGSELYQYIADFNRESEEYCIHLNEYYDGRSGEQAREDGLRKLNADIIAGTAGDILDLKSLQELISKHYYIEKGVLENLYDWIETDSETAHLDFLPNLLEADEVNGKLYDLVPRFFITTAAAKTSLVGEELSIGWEEAEKIAKEEGLSLFCGIAWQEFLYDAYLYNQEELVDWEHANCQFNTEIFKKYLVYAKTLPSQESFDYYSWGSVDVSEIYQGNVLFNPTISFDLTAINQRQSEALFGETVTNVGFPTEDGSSGSAFAPIISLGILTASDKKEDAWMFLKSFLDDSYQQSEELKRGFPVLESALELQLEKVLKQNPQGSEWDTFDVNGDMLFYGAVTESQIEAIKKLVYAVNKMNDVDWNIYQIIVEEAAVYMAGDKNLDETCELIQNRASLYLLEQQ